jgi:hypothetical protein
MLKRPSICLLLFLAGCFSTNAESISYNLSLNTTQLQAAGGNFQIDFILSGLAGNTVTVSDPNFGTGSALPGQPSTITLISNPSNFGESEVWQFTPGNLLSFTLSSTDFGPLSGFGPDNVLITLEDLSGTPFPTDDPNNALFRLALTGGADAAQFFEGTGGPIDGIRFTVTGSTGSTGSTGGGTGGGAVPEPATYAFIWLAGCGAVVLTRLSQKR